VPFLNYDNLKDAVANWLARSDLGTHIPDFVWLAECDIQRTVQFRLSEKQASGTTVNEQAYIDLPKDFVEGLYLQWQNDTSIPFMEIVSYDVNDTITRNAVTSARGYPMRGGTIHGDRLYIAATPGEVDYTLWYKAGVQHLGVDVPTNLILQQYPDTLLYGALAHSAPFLGADERLATWVGLYDNAKEETRQQEWRSRTGHGALRMRPDVVVG
jgi:hypothetical protein